jgi:hypothetical protein
MKENSNRTSTSRKWWPTSVTFLKCILLGPPLGSVVFLTARNFFPNLDTLGREPTFDLANFVFMVLVALPFSYLFGLMYAILAGVMFAGYGWANGRPPLWFACVVAAFVLLVQTRFGSVLGEASVNLMAFTCVTTVFLCWILILGTWRKRVA